MYLPKAELKRSLFHFHSKKMMSQWKSIHKTPDVFEAELLKNELLTNGISAVVLNKKDSNYLIGYFEIYVLEGNEAEAQVILDTFNSNDQSI